MLTGILCIKNVLEHHVGRTARPTNVSKANLADGSVLAKYVVHVVGSDLVRKTPEYRETSRKWSAFDIQGGYACKRAPTITYLTKRMRFTSGGSLIARRAASAADEAMCKRAV